MFKFPELPYPKNALEPVLSQKAVDVHYEKHHRKYYDILSKMIEDTSMEDKPLVDLIRATATNPYVFNAAAQIFNHEFFWNSLSPVAEQNSMPPEVEKVITIPYGTVENFKELFLERAGRHFGSGWAWFVMANDEADIWITHDAETPIKTPNVTPLLCIDLWEHSYYIDYLNDRATYLEKVFNIINWQFVKENLNKTV